MENCHNCGLPAACISGSGRKVVLHVRPRPGEKFKREHRCTVWCCGDKCAIQALAIARYGPATHKWPITLAQFRAMNPLKNLTAAKKTARETVRDLIWGDADQSRSEQPKPALQSV